MLYLKELSSRKETGKGIMIKKLPEKKTGRPPMLGNTLDKVVQAYIQETRTHGLKLSAAGLSTTATEGTSW